VESVPETVAPSVTPDPAEEGVSRNSRLKNAHKPYLIQAGRHFSRTRVAGVDVKETAERLPEKAVAPDETAVADQGPERADRLVRVHNLMAARAYLNMVNSLDDLKKEVAGDIAFNHTILGSAIAMSTGLSVGYVVWLVRGGMLLSSLLSSLPAWQILDPLPILARKKDDDLSDGDESLESILDQVPKNPEPKEKTADASSDAEVKKR
jgi:hypothetical protein